MEEAESQAGVLQSPACLVEEAESQTGSAVSLGARITQHSFQIMQKRCVQIFIPDEHVLKVPETRLPRKRDSAAEATKDVYCRK